MATIEALLTTLVDTISAEANRRGFAPVDSAAALAFGGSELRWRRGGEELRLVWDGREQWLNFERRPAPDAPATLEWTGMLSERYTGDNVSDGDISRLRGALEAILRSLWSNSSRT